MPETTLLSRLLTLAAIFLGLALLVQVLQEVYKHLVSARAGTWSGALIDYLGPWGKILLAPGALPDLRVRGPFQFRRLRPGGKLLPTDRDELVEAMERTLPAWHRRALSAIRFEEATTERTRHPGGSPEWSAFLLELQTAEPGSPGYLAAREIGDFLNRWKSTDADQPEATAALEAAFVRRFMPHVREAADNYPQLVRNFNYRYRRRNLRLTFTFGLAVAVLCNLPFDRVWIEAARTPEADAIALAERIESGDDAAAAESALNYVVDADVLRQVWANGWAARMHYLAGCLLTALLISFGAPFWNDLSKALLRLKRDDHTTRNEVGGFA